MYKIIYEKNEKWEDIWVLTAKFGAKLMHNSLVITISINLHFGNVPMMITITITMLKATKEIGIHNKNSITIRTRMYGVGAV